MEYSKEYLEAMLKHLEDRNMAWCFDLNGKLWTRETVSLALLTTKPAFVYEQPETA